MKISFSFSKKQINEILFFALIVCFTLVLMDINGADFN